MGGRQVLGLGRYCHREIRLFNDASIPTMICVLLSSIPWQSSTAPDLPRQRLLLLKLQQRGNRPSTPQFYLHTVLCSWPSKLLAPSITKAWLSLIILATAFAQITGDSRETTFLYQRVSVAIQRFNALAFMALLAMTSSKTNHLRTKKLSLNF